MIYAFQCPVTWPSACVPSPASPAQPWDTLPGIISDLFPNAFSLVSGLVPKLFYFSFLLGQQRISVNLCVICYHAITPKSAAQNINQLKSHHFRVQELHYWQSWLQFKKSPLVLSTVLTCKRLPDLHSQHMASVHHHPGLSIGYLHALA